MNPCESWSTARTVPCGNPSAVVRCVRTRGGESAADDEAAAREAAAVSNSAEPMLRRRELRTRAFVVTAPLFSYWLGTQGTIGAGACGAGACESFHQGRVRAQAKLRAHAKLRAQAKLFDQT